MTAGYTGKILRINLNNRSLSVIDTEQYQAWYAGHGMGSAIFWDLCEDKTIDGFDPRNVITIMTSPLSGTLAPGISGRCEMQGIGVQAYPIGWFTRSNFGGRFSGMLRAAGWDGIVIEGKADSPVWINIINDKVTIEDAKWLWGMDTWKTQQEIWKAVTGDAKMGDWVPVGDGRTTQRPAVLCTGPAGEHLSRSAVLMHEAGHGASQGGFGAVWGAKNLKAISVQGTGSPRVADPKALLDARLWFERNFSYHRDVGRRPPMHGAPPPGPPPVVAGCQGCPKLCSTRSNKYGNGSSCIEPMWYSGPFKNLPPVDVDESNQAGDMAQQLGINICDLAAYTMEFTKGGYLIQLHDMGLLGPGKAIDSNPLPWDKLGKLEFAESLMKAIAYRQGIGNDLAEGPARAAAKWGRLQEDLESGLLGLSQWGYVWHWSLPGVEWIYGSIVGDRDICDHEMEIDGPLGMDLYLDELTAEQHIKLISSKMVPYTGDPMMLDYTWQEADGSKMAQALETGIYSRHKAKFVAWHRHYTRFWKESIGCCDWMYANFTSPQKPDHVGFTPEAETRFLNAVTGGDLSFAESIEIGRRIWNLDRAVWILQGRHRDMEQPAGFLFKPGGSVEKRLPVYADGQWSFDVPLGGMFLDREGVETFKNHYYEFEGWDPATGWPSRSTLEGLELKNVADTLEKAGKLAARGEYTGK